MGKIKIKHRNPKRQEFTPNDIVINVKNGTLFYKSNFAIFRLQGVQTTKITPEADTISVNIEQAENQQILFNNDSVMDGSENFKYEFTDDGSGVLSNEKLVLGTDMDISGTLNMNGTIILSNTIISLPINAVAIGKTNDNFLDISSPIGSLKVGVSDPAKCDFNTDADTFEFAQRIISAEGIISSKDTDLEIRGGNTTSNTHITIKNATNVAEVHGNLTVKAKGSANGKISADNDIIAFASDKRLKENIIEISNPLDKIKQVRGIYYDWKENVKEKGFHPNRKKNEIGMIAQEVEKIIPQEIEPAPFNNDYKTIKYDRIIPLLVECIKDQQKQIDDLKNKLDGYL